MAARSWKRCTTCDISTPVARIGWPDKFIEHATSNKDLQDKYGLNAATAVAKVNELLAEVAKATVESPKFRVLGAVDARPA